MNSAATCSEQRNSPQPKSTQTLDCVSICITILIATLVLMLIWNWLVPSIFGLREISYLEAYCLRVLVGTFRQYSAKS